MSKYYQDKIDRVHNQLFQELQELRTESLAMKELLRKIRQELALRSSWSTRLATLGNEINTLLGD